jgi:hypothetical protein
VPGPLRRVLARALLIVGASGLFMAGAGAALASAGLGDTAPSMSWDTTKALEIDATPGASVSATLLNNTAAALDVRLQVDAPDEIAVTPAQLKYSCRRDESDQGRATLTSAGPVVRAI